MSKELLARAHELYEVRTRCAARLYRMELEDLRRLADILCVLDDDAIREVAGYAEGLAMWRQPDSNSVDATIAQGRPAPTTGV